MQIELEFIAFWYLTVDLLDERNTFRICLDLYDRLDV